MSLYAKVESGAVESTGGLPKNYNNISGFNKLSNEALKGYGFYPYTYTAPAFDGLTQKLGDAQYVIGADSVTGTRAVVEMSAEEKAAVKDGLEFNCFNVLNELMYDTDWIYLADAGLSPAQETAYASLRAEMILVKDALATYSVVQLNELNTLASDCKACMCSRFKDFSVKMIALGNFLNSLLG